MPGDCQRYQPKGSTFTYYANTSAVDFDTAELLCQDNGGHLASYTNANEVTISHPFAINWIADAPRLGGPVLVSLICSFLTCLVWWWCGGEAGGQGHVTAQTANLALACSTDPRW